MKRTLPGRQASKKQLVGDSSKHEFEKDVELVGEMSRAGVDIIAGTDVLNPFCFPGFSLADELELYVKAGFFRIEALRTATDGKYYPRETLDAMPAKAQTLASRKSIAETLSQTIAARGISAAIQQCHEPKTSQSGEYDFGEEELNTLG